MFTKFRVRNFKTHLDTEIELKDLTLLIGSNNSGKTNLLKAISFFSDLIKESNKPNEEVSSDYIYELWSEHFHKLHANYYEKLGMDTLIEFEGVLAESEIEKYVYTIELKGKSDVYDYEELYTHEITEKLQIFKRDRSTQVFNHNEDYNDFDLLKEDLIKGMKKYSIKKAIENMSNTIYLNLYPKGLFTHQRNSNAINFINLLSEAKQSESEYDRVMSYLRNFEESLIGININDDIVKWCFDMGNNNIAVLDSDEVSDGLLKAAAIALICASEDKPSIIMIDEIENGINQHNLVKLISWLKHVSDNGKNTQFILTSHSPSVIREFSDNLDSVYTVHLKRKKGYFSEVTNLNEALKMINRLGGLKEETVEEVDGVLHVRKYALTELFYNGILGEL